MLNKSNNYYCIIMSQIIILNQVKLSKDEWKSVESPVSPDERTILELLMEGFNNTSVVLNKNKSLLTHLSLSNIDKNTHYFLYEKYIKPIFVAFFADKDKKTTKKTSQTSQTSQELPQTSQKLLLQLYEKIGTIIEKTEGKNIAKLKKADEIRLSLAEKNINDLKKNNEVFDFVLCDLVINAFQSLITSNKNDLSFVYYTLHNLQKITIANINIKLLDIINKLCTLIAEQINATHIFANAVSVIGENSIIAKYTDKTLYKHQKDLFTSFNKIQSFNSSKLVFYIAPTGTGKTISPLGLTSQIKYIVEGKEMKKTYKIIYCCVARHIGLAFGKSCISMGKKIAFAFGCSSASDVRLHFNAINSYEEKTFQNGNKTIKKNVVNHTDGANVQIIICDVVSYLVAMNYMLSFNDENEIIFYWDEPTITLDYENHPLHSIIRNNWLENRISKVILSSATLPNQNELSNFIGNFMNNFNGAKFEQIISHDFHHSISLLDTNNKIMLPHTLYKTSFELHQSILFCQENKTLLRYFDLQEIITFLQYLQIQFAETSPIRILNYFANIDDLTVANIKEYYLICLKQIDKSKWTEIVNNYFLQQNNEKNGCKKIHSINNADLGVGVGLGVETTDATHFHRTMTNNNLQQSTTTTNGIHFTTIDAHTLTDGATYYFAEDVDKIALFLLQIAKIPNTVYEDIERQLQENQEYVEKILSLEREIEDETNLDEKQTKKLSKVDEDNVKLKGSTQNALFQLQQYQNKLKTITIAEKYIPNTVQHQAIWNTSGIFTKNAFVANIVNEDLQKIIATDAPNNIKILLMIGIGVFCEKYSKKYLELMKEFATQQKLFIIIAQSDYIYGTNYSACHGVFGKDLQKMTKQKLIQALGRIARVNGGKHYTGRFRNAELIYNLFLPQIGGNIEANKMNELLVGGET